MKYLPILFFLLIGSAAAAQSTTIEVTAKGCTVMHLYSFNGSGFDRLTTFDTAEEGRFSLETEAEEPVFRYVGPTAGDVLPLIVGGDEVVSITGTCGRMRGGQISASAINTRYQQLKTGFSTNNRRFSAGMKAWQAATAKGDSVTVKEELAAMAALDREKLDVLAKVKEESPLLARVVSLNTYLSFLNENKGRFPNELDYFVNTYFQHVDVNDAGYGELPWTYEGNRNFAQTLAAAVPGEQLADILMAVYNRWPEGSRARFLSMSGGFASLAQKKHPAALPVADAIIKQFGEKYASPVARIKKQAAGMRTFAIGVEAPLFEGPTPEGETIKLESLRGKVVLIDFWASWCGPCRRENPKVVKMYNKHKDQGFEILAVSLDKTKDRWVKAIDADKLTWLHISDLKGWKSKYAAQYGVSSIPQTVLLDREGRILARNLRGAALEKKVAEVLAEGK